MPNIQRNKVFLRSAEAKDLKKEQLRQYIEQSQKQELKKAKIWARLIKLPHRTSNSNQRLTASPESITTQQIIDSARTLQKLYKQKPGYSKWFYRLWWRMSRVERVIAEDNLLEALNSEADQKSVYAQLKGCEKHSKFYKSMLRYFEILPAVLIGSDLLTKLTDKPSKRARKKAHDVEVAFTSHNPVFSEHILPRLSAQDVHNLSKTCRFFHAALPETAINYVSEMKRTEKWPRRIITCSPDLDVGNMTYDIFENSRKFYDEYKSDSSSFFTSSRIRGGSSLITLNVDGFDVRVHLDQACTTMQAPRQIAPTSMVRGVCAVYCFYDARSESSCATAITIMEGATDRCNENTRLALIGVYAGQSKCLDLIKDRIRKTSSYMCDHYFIENGPDNKDQYRNSLKELLKMTVRSTVIYDGSRFDKRNIAILNCEFIRKGREDAIKQGLTHFQRENVYIDNNPGVYMQL